MSEEASERFARLESHIAHLEHQVEQLNEVIVEQGKSLDQLCKVVQRQAATLEMAESERARLINPKPPHH